MRAVPVGNLRYTLVSSIARLEVQVGCPVVGEIVRVTAGGARGLLRDIGYGHGCVECISSDLYH